MMRRVTLFAALFVCVLLATPNALGHGDHGGSHAGGIRSGGSSHSSKSGKTEHVGSYKRKDGKAVESYDRHPAYSTPAKQHSTRIHGPSHPVSASKKHATQQHGKKHYDEAVAAQRDRNGKIHRSVRAKDEFKKSHPCPSTGRSSGACPAYVIDHIKPLKRAGLDQPSNMQWQTVAEAKAKDKWE